ncbi:MAG: hypothetical protein IH996_09360 [Proteobacteria bacterium]|nr:hypothetical protein [Pseudomonadota bacterium]
MAFRPGLLVGLALSLFFETSLYIKPLGNSDYFQNWAFSSDQECPLWVKSRLFFWIFLNFEMIFPKRNQKTMLPKRIGFIICEY